jgi:large subunit ribosomal protein L35
MRVYIDVEQVCRMHKFKTHKGLRKRVRITAKGKVTHKKVNAGHLMSGKNAKRRRRLRKPGLLTGADAKRVRTALGL